MPPLIHTRHAVLCAPQVLIIASLGVWRREKQLGRIAAIPTKPKEGQPLDWKFKTLLCCRRTGVVCAYTWNDILPPLCSLGAVGLVVSAMITSMSDIGGNRDGTMTIIEKVRRVLSGPQLHVA